MVCSKCAKLTTGTKLATPGVKKKSDMYYGSPATSSAAGDKKSATLGQTGVGKVGLISLLQPVGCQIRLTNFIPPLQSKLLSKNAKNPYAQYAR